MRFYKALMKLQKLRVFYYWLMSDHKTARGLERLQPVLVTGKGRIVFGTGVKIGYYPSPLFFSTYAHLEARYESASIDIGNNTIINNNCCLLAEYSSITIGERCFIGTGLEVMTSDFHGLEPDQRIMSLPEWNAPVVVGDDVFIGNGVRILKGVSIGAGAVIAGGSVVTRDVPAYTVAAGNPARIIRHLGRADTCTGQA